MQDVQAFNTFFGGGTYYDQASNGSYKWSIQSEKEVIDFCNYIKSLSLSCKGHRIKLVPKYYYLKNLRAYAHSMDTAHYKKWVKFKDSWNHWLNN